MTQAEVQFVGTMMPILYERQRRIFLGSFAMCLGYGGATELSTLTGVSRTTIIQGKADIMGMEINLSSRRILDLH